jgi:hypothetical protein
MTLDEPTEASPTLRLDEWETVLEGEVPRRRQVIAPPVETDRLWTPEEVARFLGVPVHTLTVGGIWALGRKPVASAAIFAICLPMSSRGFGNNRRRDKWRVSRICGPHTPIGEVVASAGSASG